MAQKFKGLEYGKVYTLIKQEDGEEIKAVYDWTRNEDGKDPRHRFVYRDSGDDNIPIVLSVKNSVINITGDTIAVTDNSDVQKDGIMPATGKFDKKSRQEHSRLIKLLNKAGI